MKFSIQYFIFLIERRICRDERHIGRFWLLEVFAAGFKKLVIRSHVFKLRPLFYAHGRIVHVVYARAAHGENEGRMGCDYKLAAVKARAVA